MQKNSNQYWTENGAFFAGDSSVWTWTFKLNGLLLLLSNFIEEKSTDSFNELYLDMTTNKRKAFHLVYWIEIAAICWV